jgi:tetratricopeptide (TPR) repeat protein
MKRRTVVIFVVLILFALFSACSRRIVPGLKPGKQGKNFDEASFSYVYVEAIKQKLMGNMGDALKYFEQCLSMNPQSGACYYQMAQIVLNNGDGSNGKKYLLKATSFEPGNIWYNLLLASIYYQQKNIDSAIVCYERTVKVYPEREDLQISLANLYTEDKKFERSRSILNHFDEKYGVNENTTVSLVRNLIAEEKYREAILKIRELLVQKPEDVMYNGLLAEMYRKTGDIDKATEVYKELIRRNPDNPQIQLSLCDFMISEKSYEDLFMFLNTVVLNNKITREDKMTLFGGLIDNTDIEKNYGKEMELAIMLMEATYKNDDIVVLMLPDFLQKENKKIDAAVNLEEIIKIKPENYFAWEKLLLVYYDLKDYKKLEERGEECATKFNRSLLAKILYASGAMENKNYSTALEELRKADILAGDNKEQKLQVLSMKADIYYRMKDFTNAFKSYDEALSLNDTDLTVLNNYAYYLAEQNMRLKDAEGMARKVIEKARNNTTFLDTYAWVLYKRGKTRDAAKIMQKVIESGEKDDAEWYEHYGYILKKMGKCEEAARKWEKALSIDKSKTELQKEIENCKN